MHFLPQIVNILKYYLRLQNKNKKLSEIALIWKVLICFMQNYANYAENVVKCCVKINICVTVLVIFAYQLITYK